MLSCGSLCGCHGKIRVRPFRGYFAFYMVLADMTEAEARIYLSFDGGETTGISQIEDGKLKIENGVYDLQGRRMASSILKKGLYVNDGRKVIIK